MGPQTAFLLPDRLPELPASLPERIDLERVALTLAAGCAECQVWRRADCAQSWPHADHPVLNLLDLGLTRKASEGNASSLGYELSIRLPLFDWGESRIEKGRGPTLIRAVNRAAETASERAFRGARGLSRLAHCL